MLVARERLTSIDSEAVADTLSLSYDRRLHTRQRACLDDGEHIALMLPRGTVLRDGDVLRCEGGRLVRVQAALECVSRVASKNARELARAAYHLGNRHVPLEIGSGFVAYLHDHVLDDMVHRLGMHVTVATAPFNPEPGAYGHSHESHSHPHSHDHSHPKAQDPSHESDSAHPPP